MSIKTDTQEKTELDRFMDRWNKKLERRQAVVNWHVQLYLATGTELPYTCDSEDVYCNQEVQDENGNWITDEDATVKYMAKVIKFASSLHMKVDKPEMKEWETNFRVVVHISEGISVEYIVDRNIVCTPKVVGKEFRPATMTPARAVDVVEWECTKLSFLAVDTSE